MFGGGRRKFLKITDKDYFLNKYGDRKDNRNLIDEWNNIMNSKKLKHKFLWNYTDFQNLRPNQYDHILGLLSYNHFDYEIDRVEKKPIQEPSIVEMTKKSIELLSVNKNGYFLLIEGYIKFISIIIFFKQKLFKKK